MAVNTSNVTVGTPDRITGAVMSAPLGTPLPTDATTVPNAAFKDAGYITEDGVTLNDDQSWTDIKDWGGDTVRRIKSESAVTLTTAFLEINAESAKAAFSDANVTQTGAKLAIKINVNEPVRKSWIVNMLDGTRYVRLVIPDGQVTERAEMVFNRQGAVTVPVTVSAYPDATANTVYLYAEPLANKAAATNGDVFTEATVTASDSTNAAKLGPLGYVANPATVWTTGQKITVSGYLFHWNGTAWTAGAKP